MSMLQIRNIPDSLKRALRRRAREQGQSMSEYVLGLVRKDLERPRLEDVLRMLDDLPASSAGPSGAELLEEARREAGADR